MKFFKKMTLLTVALTGAALGLAGCKSTAKMPVTFVAATASDYNAEVEIGDYVYKFRGKVDQKSDNFLLEGLAQSRKALTKSSGGGQGGKGLVVLREGEEPGQGGSKGGGEESPAPTSLSIKLDRDSVYLNEAVEVSVEAQPSDASTDVTWTSSDEEVITVEDGKIKAWALGTATITATSSKAQDVKVSKTISVVEEDMEPHNWSLGGKWTMDEGYGYVITLDDERKTEIHADFDKIQGRHQFYYTVEIEKNKSTILFQAKDPTFKDRLAKDYASWDVRDSKYIYYAKATGNNNSVATAYLYLHNDGSGVINAPVSRSANRTNTFGLTWTENNGIITLVDGEKQYVSKTSVNTAHPGSLLVTDDYTFLRSDNPDVKWKKLTVADFEGATAHEFSGSYTTTGPDGKTNTVQLCFFESGEAKIYENGSFSPLAAGTWSEDAGAFSMTIDNKVYHENEDHSFDYKITVKTSKGTNSYDVHFERTK